MADDKNPLSVAGWTGINDQDYMDEFGVDVKTPEGIRKMFDIVEARNYNAYIEAGLSEKAAKERAADQKRTAMATMRDQLPDIKF